LEVRGIKRQKAAGIKNEGFNNWYSLLNIMRMTKSGRVRWARHVARMRETRRTYKILIGKPEGKFEVTRPLERSMLRWENNVKIDTEEIVCMCTGFI
jgi:hypothetical protein